MKNHLLVCISVLTAFQTLAQPPFPAKNVLDLYAELKGRTILRPSFIPGLPASVLSQGLADTNQAAALIESELAKNHVEVVPDGEKFLRILPDGWRNSAMEAYLTRIQPPAAPDPRTSANPPHKTDETGPVPQALINFSGVEVNEVLKVYAEIRNRTILRPLVLPGGPITLRNQTPLSKQDLAYAMNVVLALNGLAALDDGNKFVQIVPLHQAAQFEARAPRPEKDSPLIDPVTVPSFQAGSSHFLRAGPRPSIPGAETGAGFASPIQPSANSTVNDLVAFYAKLSDLEALPDERYGNQPILFKATTPLTKAELLYGLDTTLALNGLTIARVGDKSIQAAPLIRNR